MMFLKTEKIKRTLAAALVMLFAAGFAPAVPNGTTDIFNTSISVSAENPKGSVTVEMAEVLLGQLSLMTSSIFASETEKEAYKNAADALDAAITKYNNDNNVDELTSAYLAGYKVLHNGAENYVYAVDIDPSTDQPIIEIDDVIFFNTIVSPGDARTTLVTYSSSSENVKLYYDQSCSRPLDSNGICYASSPVYTKGIKEGTATITVTSGDNSAVTDSFDITVIDTKEHIRVKYQEWDSSAKKYIEKECTDCTELSSTLTGETITWEDGKTYFVDKADLSIYFKIIVNGNVNLILCDDTKLTTNGIIVNSGNTLNIYAQSSGDKMGTLEAQGRNNNAGIGGYDSNCGTVIIHGGNVTAKGNAGAAGIGGANKCSGGTITINGGIVNVTGGSDSNGSGAGIGGGYNGASGTITINGGTVTAYADSIRPTGGAGIGSGYGGVVNTITINDGTVTATGGTYSAGIGSSTGRFGGNIIINGGTVTATGGSGTYGSGAGIGGGYSSRGGSNVTINGGTVTANGGRGADGIGAGSNDSSSGTLTLGEGMILYGGSSEDPTTPIMYENNDYARFRYMIAKKPTTGVSLKPSTPQGISVGGVISFTAAVTPKGASDSTVKWRVNDSKVALFTDEDCTIPVGDNATSVLTVYAKGITAGTDTVTVTSNADSTINASCNITVHDPVTYQEWNGYTITDAVRPCTDFTLLMNRTEQITLTTGTYVVDGTVEIPAILVTGNVKLILCDGAKLIVKRGITVNKGNTLNIYAQSSGDNMGTLTATGYNSYAGIGGRSDKDGGDIYIHGGKVTAKGGNKAAGIGGGCVGSGGDVYIFGGNVTAKGGSYAAGIGGGYNGDGGDVYIFGGNVTANGDNFSAGIGGGCDGSGGNVLIKDGTVSASGTNGIGSGNSGGNQGSIELGAGMTLYGGANTIGGQTYEITKGENNDYERTGYMTAKRTSLGFFGASLTLGDDLALNFFAEGITAENCNQYRVDFSGECVEKSSILVLKNGKYCATTHIYAKNMNKKITASLYKGNELIDTIEYSATDYLRSNAYTNADNKTKALFKATILYGIACDEFFNGGDKGYGSALSAYYAISGKNEGNLREIAWNNSAKAKGALISLVLDSKMAVRIYIPGVAAGTEIGGITSIASKNDAISDEYPSYFEYTVLTPKDLANTIQITVDGNTYEFSALSWADSVLAHSDDTDNPNVKIALAIVAYYSAAAEYSAK